MSGDFTEKATIPRKGAVLAELYCEKQLPSKAFNTHSLLQTTFLSTAIKAVYVI